MVAGAGAGVGVGAVAAPTQAAAMNMVQEMIVLAVVMGDGINSKQFAKGGYCTDSSFYLTSRSFDTSVSCEFVYESE